MKISSFMHSMKEKEMYGESLRMRAENRRSLMLIPKIMN